MTKYRFIELNSGRYPLRAQCEVMAVSASGYHAWRNRVPSKRDQANQRLITEIRRVFKASRETYGSPRVHAELVAEGIKCSENRVAHLMRKHGLRAVTRRRNLVVNDRSQNWQQAPNHLRRRFATGRLPAWVADLTQVYTPQGIMHLAVVMNMYSRRIIGWRTGKKADGALVCEALEQAFNTVAPVPGQLHHTDRGGQYVSREYQSLVRQSGMVLSMSRAGNCHDNAVMESMFASLKCELLYRCRPKTYNDANRMIAEYIDVFYNQLRRHSALNFLSPIAYEKLYGAS